jgi:hypothetical protein
MLALVIAHDHLSLCVLAEKAQDFGRLRPAIDTISDGNDVVRFTQSGLIQKRLKFGITTLDIAND